MFQDCKWIWPESTFQKNQRAAFFFTAHIQTIPEKAELLIGCETKYWLFVNERLVIFDGGLFRESTPGCGWFDRVDIAAYLRQGINRITVHVWYFGNGGRNNSAIHRGGLILSCEALQLRSNAQTPGRILRAYGKAEGEPTFLYGGDHTLYNALTEPFSLCPTTDSSAPCQEIGQYADSPWGELLERPIPHLFFGQRTPCPYTRSGTLYTVSLPYAMQFSPYIKLSAHGGETLRIHSDRYVVHGGPGDSNSYFGHRAEYICREGIQEFEMPDWIFGEQILYTVPEGVTVLELGYRESGYDAQVTTSFECDRPEINVLFQKCIRTLQICMRENFMDCPDRERGQWIGDVSVQTPQVVYLLNQNGLKLLHKAIFDFIRLRKEDCLVGNVPGDNWSELPSQSLNAISEYGMIASYYAATRDRTVLELAFEPVIKYLMLFKTDPDGVALPRSGNWEWYDHLYNQDMPILNICWYYSALRFARTMAGELDRHDFDDFIHQRMTAIEAVFETRYWNADLQCYASGGLIDDRANAMAVLSGLCPKENYPRMEYILMSVFNSTPYMENYVLMALCEMGYRQSAFRRMMSRYQPLIDNQNTTLWEDFFHLGTRNHAWSGGPATILLRYFAGIQADLSVKETDIAPLKHLRCSFNTPDGQCITIDRQAE